jgi:hypothetical protein
MALIRFLFFAVGDKPIMPMTAAPFQKLPLHPEKPFHFRFHIVLSFIAARESRRACSLRTPTRLYMNFLAGALAAADPLNRVFAEAELFSQ